MQNHVKMFSTLLLLLCIACSQELNSRIHDHSFCDYKLSTEVKVVYKKCNIYVSPKMEALTVVQYLADDPIVLKNNYDEANAKYAAELLGYFNFYKEDPVVLLYKKLHRDGFRLSRIPELAIRIDNAFNLRGDIPDLNDYLDMIGTDMENLNNFLFLLSCFC